MYLPQNVDKITMSDIEALINNQISEGRLIDFKSNWSIRTDEEKKEFLADMTSFANTMGGHLVFGVREEQLIAKEVVGIGITVDPEKAIQSMENLALTTVAPRHSSIRYKHVPGQNGGVIVGYIAPSWAKPHVVTLGGYWRVFARQDTGKYQLTVEQFKGLVNNAEEVAERVRRFRIERVSKVVSDDTPQKLRSVNNRSAALLIHIVPIDSFGNNTSVFSPYDLSDEITIEKYLKTIASGNHVGFNFDGLLVSERDYHEEVGIWGYNQVFRNGVVEIADMMLLHYPVRGEPAILSPYFEITTKNKIEKIFTFYKERGIFPPFAVLYSLIGVKGFKCVNENQATPMVDGRYQPSLISRDLLLFSEVVFEDMESIEKNLFVGLKPVFDALWNAAGRARCPFYEIKGNTWEFTGKLR